MEEIKLEGKAKEAEEQTKKSMAETQEVNDNLKVIAAKSASPKANIKEIKAEMTKEYFKVFAVGDGYDFKGRKFRLKHIDKNHNHLIFESVDLPKTR
ncbi:MAG: hypothetical protein DRQ46_00120 [Gammaproteobacteria bacterium]|nr:MAG: hypothetical protein DRQ46_00120 [Gammaproteobacteria bacterium]